MFPNQFLALKNKFGKTREFLFSYWCPYARFLRFLCTWPVCVYAFLVHTTCARPSVVALHLRSRTPKIFRLITRTTILALQSMGFRREQTMTLSLSLEVEDKVSLKVVETLASISIYRVPLLGLSDLSPPRLRSLNQPKMDPNWLINHIGLSN